MSSTPRDPEIGVIYQRELHPAARSLGELLDPETLNRVLCDEHLPLSEALAREWSQDAHLLLYSIVDEDGDTLFARAKKKNATLAAEVGACGGHFAVPILVLDLDLPGHAEWTEDALADAVLALEQITVPQPTYWYSTLHGSRFVYVLSRDVSQLELETLAKVMVRRFAAEGLAADESCVDWTRVFRLPKTVRADTGKPFHEDPRFVLVDGGPELDPDPLLAVLPDEQPDVEAVVVPEYEGDRPDPDQVQALLTQPGKRGRDVMSDWVRVARNMLRGREAFDVCFDHAPLDVGSGWNNSVVRLVGQVVAMTARTEEATPEGVYAVLYGALEQLQANEQAKGGPTDWLAKGWEIVCRMWTNEQAQVQAELAKRELEVAEAGELRGKLLQQLRKAKPGLVPKDDAEAQAWFRRQMLASDGKHHFVMRRDGSYNLKAVNDAMLVPMIRELGMSDVIETHKLAGKSWVPRGASDILNDHATPIVSVHCSSRLDVAHVDGDSGYKELHVPVHRLSAKVHPRFSKQVDEWLKALFGAKYAIAIEWLSWCLDVSGPICALNLWGSPGTGKGMLVQGIAECFEGERVNDGRAFGKFNEGLLHTPIIWCDEGVPSMRSDESLTVDQAFRTFVSGGKLIIRSMHMNPFNADIYPRILFTSNDRDIAKAIIGGRDLTDDDIRAIELRLLSVHVGDGAVTHLTARGNYNYTSGWIAGRESSKYVIAGHIRWLYENRKPPAHGTGRLLVEGEVQAPLVRSMRLRSESAQGVLRALVRMIESAQPVRGVHVSQGCVLVTSSGVVDYAERALSGLPDLTLTKVGTVLRQFADLAHEGGRRFTPRGSERGHWVQLDLAVLLEEALRYGMVCDRVEKILREQPGGNERATLAHEHARDADD